MEALKLTLYKLAELFSSFCPSDVVSSCYLKESRAPYIDLGLLGSKWRHEDDTSSESLL